MSKLEYNYFLKAVLVGNPGVGKTSFLTRFTDDEFSQSYLPTIGVDFKFKFVQIQNKKVKLQVWDTAGQERYRSLCNIYYKGADYIIVVFDLSDVESLNSVVNDWIPEVSVYCSPHKTKLLLIGNKQDMEDPSITNEKIQQQLLEKCKCNLKFGNLEGSEDMEKFN